MVKTDYLLEIASILQKGISSDETFEAVFDLLDKTVPFDYATLFLYDQSEDKLEVIHQKGDQLVDLAAEFDFMRGKGMSSWISQHENLVILPSLVRSRPGKERRFSSFVSMPLRVADKLIGVLNIGHRQSDTYHREESQEYQTVATQISTVMDKLLLRRKLQQKNEELEKALKELKKAQKQLIEEKRFAAIGEIVVTVNHEINNPLTSIIGLAEILELSCHTSKPEKIREGLKSIMVAAKKIQKVTSQLSKISSSTTSEYIGSTKMIKLPKD